MRRPLPLAGHHVSFFHESSFLMPITLNIFFPTYQMLAMLKFLRDLGVLAPHTHINGTEGRMTDRIAGSYS